MLETTGKLCWEQNIYYNRSCTIAKELGKLDVEFTRADPLAVLCSQGVGWHEGGKFWNLVLDQSLPDTEWSSLFYAVLFIH